MENFKDRERGFSSPDRGPIFVLQRRWSRIFHSVSVMEYHKANASDPVVLQNLMRNLAIKQASGTNASACRCPGQTIVPPVVAPADVFGPYGEISWDPEGDAEYEARVARKIALEAQRGKRKRSAMTRAYKIRNPYYQAETEDSEEESFCQKAKRQNSGFNPRRSKNLVRF